ncbi:hypothetical protein HF313_12960 [Massilia atriviolacea]|uniref:Hemolysin XhlA n=1 Tax=Massilia atriviolacea TaxID=2495579 RepID=A0A430HQ61_9BURK|nr:hypothetical protein [Massilia atriviolacea]RSZ59656.1 hypothetical protein EJB06_05510 [Massilia atriviolacea]
MDIMEARIVRLELAVEKILERLSAVECDIAVIRSNYATKADIAALQAAIAALETRMLKWFIGSAITLAGAAFAAAKWIN